MHQPITSDDVKIVRIRERVHMQGSLAHHRLTFAADEPSSSETTDHHQSSADLRADGRSDPSEKFSHFRAFGFEKIQKRHFVFLIFRSIRVLCYFCIDFVLCFILIIFFENVLLNNSISKTFSGKWRL
jgi:hypothetical protein